MWLLAAFILVPLIEIGLFIQVGGLIGLWPTLLIVLLSAIAGTMMVRSQGARALSDLRRSFSDLRDPSEPLAHGAMILFAGALLLTPGFFTDFIGFALCIPAVRTRAMAELGKRVRVRQFSYGTGRPQEPRRPHPADTRSSTIDGHAEEVEIREPDPNRPRSGWTRPE